MKFTDLQLIEPILKALTDEGYETPTPIQQQAIPIVLNKIDLLGCAQTGTGKTAAFAIPMLQNLYKTKSNEKGFKKIKALVLTPTRELAIQIDESFKAYGRYTGITSTVIFGGVGQKPQTDALRRGIDILIATPGRLLDLMNQGFVDLRSLEVFVLDEADRMLDMGFVNDVKKVIAKLPFKRQTLFFSATMPPEITKLANTILHKPEKVEVTPVSSTAETIKQAVYFVDKNNKRNLLVDILNDKTIKSALVFTRTKHVADKISKELAKAGIKSAAIHGNKSQNARQKALSDFKDNTIRALVATDIAARGIDIDDLTHVINYDLPNVPESYVHRIGRTGRAGAKGIALSFCDFEEKAYLKDIQKVINISIPVIDDHDYPMQDFEIKPKEQPRGRSPRSDQQPRGNRPKSNTSQAKPSNGSAKRYAKR